MPKTYKTFTVTELSHKFDYNPDTGELTHKQGRFKGKVAGSPLEANGGYRYLCLGKSGKGYSLVAHRVIWGIYSGEFAPEDMVIDHVDGDPDNNRIKNLRAVTKSESQKNKGRRKKQVNQRYVLTSVTGVKFDKEQMCYVAMADSQELCRTLSFDDAKYARWGWEFENNYTDRH